ncbi:hypothetical protein EVAR_91005_1 [Eumeta japonica]|uniref:Uncharacterized protein n=1 Tax=Eumeta variegata TaxID=151549 RepID=A0A4C1SNL7_EUMVA|nr:hypothetical protein EVAR_91005_1 [Eumeta japonica]
MNTAKCDSTGYSPAYLTFGRELRTPTEVNYDLKAIVKAENFIPQKTPHLLKLADTLELANETQIQMHERNKHFMSVVLVSTFVEHLDDLCASALVKNPGYKSEWTVSSVPKISRDKDADSINSHNRFSLLKDKNDEVTVTTKSSKPPPIYLRKKFECPHETKIQVNTETDYRKITAELDKDKKDYYTYQLKSAKGMQIVLKGIDSCVDPLECNTVEKEENEVQCCQELSPLKQERANMNKNITNLKKKAEKDVVEPYQVTEPNYQKTLERLKEMHDNKVLIFLEHQ